MNTKFKSIVTGAILEPNSEMVAEQLLKNPSFVVYDGQEAAQGDEKPLDVYKRQMFGPYADRFWKVNLNPLALECKITGNRIIFRGVKDQRQRENCLLYTSRRRIPFTSDP